MSQSGVLPSARRRRHRPEARPPEGAGGRESTGDYGRGGGDGTQPARTCEANYCRGHHLLLSSPSSDRPLSSCPSDRPLLPFQTRFLESQRDSLSTRLKRPLSSRPSDRPLLPFQTRLLESQRDSLSTRLKRPLSSRPSDRPLLPFQTRLLESQRDSLSTRLKRQKLEAMFPQLDGAVLDDVYGANG